MAREQWFIDSYEVTVGLVRDVETRDGLYAAPAAAGANPSVTNRTGEVWRPKKYAAGGFILNVWVAAAANQTGQTGQTAAQTAYDNMLRACAHVHRMPLFRRIGHDGVERQAYGEVVSAIAPQPITRSGLGYRFGIEVRVPSGLWRAVSAATDTSAPGTTPRDLVLASFTGTGPIEDGVVSITGPVTNPRVADRTDGVDGTWFQWTGTIPGGVTYTFNCGTYETTAPNPAAIAFNGSQFLYVPAAPPGGARTLRLTGSGSSSATALAFTAKNSWLV